MARALITGVTGQDGSYLAERLTSEGLEVHGLTRPHDSLAKDVQSSCPDLALHEGDITDRAFLASFIADVAPDEIYNLAGISSVAQSWQEPELTAEVNAMAVAHLLQLALKLQEHSGRTVRILQASSAEIFGNSDDVPQTEATPLRPGSPYGASKAYAHHLCHVYRARGLQATTTILYNHESPRRPTTFVTRKITHGVALIAAGSADHLSLGNLDAKRDWGWAPDYVDAMIRAQHHDAPEDFLIATGKPHSVREFAEAAFARVGIDDADRYLRVDPQFNRPSDAKLQVGDASKAERLLGWKPTVAFAEIVGRMVDHDLELLTTAKAPD